MNQSDPTIETIEYGQHRLQKNQVDIGSLSLEDPSIQDRSVQDQSIQDRSDQEVSQTRSPQTPRSVGDKIIAGFLGSIRGEPESNDPIEKISGIVGQQFVNQSGINATGLLSQPITGLLGQIFGSEAGQVQTIPIQIDDLDQMKLERLFFGPEDKPLEPMPKLEGGVQIKNDFQSILNGPLIVQPNSQVEILDTNLQLPYGVIPRDSELTLDRVRLYLAGPLRVEGRLRLHNCDVVVGGYGSSDLIQVLGNMDIHTSRFRVHPRLEGQTVFQIGRANGFRMNHSQVKCYSDRLTHLFDSRRGPRNYDVDHCDLGHRGKGDLILDRGDRIHFTNNVLEGESRWQTNGEGKYRDNEINCRHFELL